MKTVENQIVIDKGNRIVMSIFADQDEPVLSYRYPGHFEISSPEYRGQLIHGKIAILDFLAQYGLDENLELIEAKK